MAGNDDGFYQEAAFLMGMTADVLRQRVSTNVAAFKVPELKQLLQILKDKHYDVLGYHHNDLRLSGNKQELADRLTGFLGGQGMELLRSKGAFAVMGGWQAPQPPHGGAASAGAAVGAGPASSSSGREVICIDSSDEEEQPPQPKPQATGGPMVWQGQLQADEDYSDEDEDEDDEEEEEEEEEEQVPRRRRGRPRTRHMQHPPRPVQIPHMAPPMAPFGMAMHPHAPGLNAHPGRVHVNYADYVMGSMPALIGGGAMGLSPPQPHVVQGGMGEPKRHSAGKGGDSPSGKKARTAGEQAQSGGGNVEVKLEPVDPFTAMKPTLMERAATVAMMNESGIGAAECLTALRLTNYNVQEAINFFVSALDYERNDIETLAAASIASEEENDRRKAAERRAMEELQHSGDVMGSKMFIGSLLLDPTHGSRALRSFLSTYCSTPSLPTLPSSTPASLPPASPPLPPAADPPQPPSPMSQRRTHIVRLLMWELRGVKCYREPARAYISLLIQRLDSAAASLEAPPIPPPGSPEEEARWERILPLDMVRREADTLEQCIVAYPSGNTNGVPPLFLQARGTQINIETDGVELMDIADGKGGEGEGGGGEGKGGRKSVQPECIEIEDDD